MTDKEVEDIIRSNMNLQMNLAGIQADFEQKLQRTWVGLTDEEIQYCVELKNPEAIAEEVEAKLKEKNT